MPINVYAIITGLWLTVIAGIVYFVRRWMRT